MQNQWDEIDYNKAHYLIENGYVMNLDIFYLIENGYVMNLDIFELAKMLYNKRIAEETPPSYKDNVGLFGKVFD